MAFGEKMWLTDCDDRDFGVSHDVNSVDFWNLFNDVPSGLDDLPVT